MTTEPKPVSCLTCICWAPTAGPVDGKRTGECRHYPPSVGDDLWPITKEDDWCYRWLGYSPSSGVTDLVQARYGREP